MSAPSVAGRRHRIPNTGTGASCDYPTLDPQIHHVATGALMGDGSLKGRERAKLRIETMARAFALWLHEQFGMAAGSICWFLQDGPD
ncbi:hypothetical protein [Saliphagus infecundisoli]|nr:hypothetical protein [Saliphagus infecundisoli]